MRSSLRYLLGFAAILLLAGLAYMPGLRGGFLFDDFVNLDALGRYGPVDDWAVFWRYVTSGTADPLGRPLALLSFLIDAHDWPADPWPFLRTNLVLHLFNGALLFALLRMLGRALGGPAKPDLADAAAMVAAAAWLLHPLFVSTTLYVVQRQAMLPVTFTLLGLIAYSLGRERYQSTGGQRGTAWMLVGLVAGTALATLSKANGILLPLLAGVLEICIFRRMHGPDSRLAKLRGIHVIAIVLPTLVVLAYLIQPLARWDAAVANRPWTIGQRVLTEPRVLLDYLQLLVVPRSVSTGLFNDGYAVSTGWLHPWTTIPALVLVTALVGLGIAGRRRWPALSCALLFFFVGHALESTTLPLELYFEHRNYLPAMLLFWPAARALLSWRKPAALRVAVCVAILGLLAATTFQRSLLWGQPEKLATLWAMANPDSARAQASAAIQDSQAGYPGRALDRLEREWQRHPDQLQIAFNVIDLRCANGGTGAQDSAGLRQALLRTDLGALMMTQWLERAVEVAAAGSCPGLDLDAVEAWVQAAQANPRLGNAARKSEDLDPVRALLALRRHQPDLALHYFNLALKAKPSPDGAARHVVALATSEYYEQALAHLKFYESLPPPAPRKGFTMSRLHWKILEWQGYWPRELAILRTKLEAELSRGDTPAPAAESR